MTYWSDVEKVILDSTALVRLHQYDIEAALLMAGKGLRNRSAEYQAEIVAEARLQIPEKYLRKDPETA